MRFICLGAAALLLSPVAHAQNFRLAPAPVAQVDTPRFNMYGDLREDNPVYNPKSPLWICGVRVVASNILTWASDRIIFNADFARIGPSTWSHNIKTGWEWDTDRFGMNFFLHPYTGAGYFNAARWIFVPGIRAVRLRRQPHVGIFR